MKSKHLNMIIKIYKEHEQYDWQELESTNKYYVKDVFPENIEKKINTYYAILEGNLMIVIGNFYYKFYYDEDLFREEKQEYVSINVLNDSNHIRNIETITSSDLQRFMRQNDIDLMLNDIEIKNYIELLYGDVNEKVNSFDDIYNSFMNEDKT